jgi:hypothetical protein
MQARDQHGRASMANDSLHRVDQAGGSCFESRSIVCSHSTVVRTANPDQDAQGMPPGAIVRKVLLMFCYLSCFLG